MKKFLKTLSIILVIIFLICLTEKLGILDFSVLTISQEKLANYSGYYFEQLGKNEKEMYVRLDEAIKDRKEKVFLGIYEANDVSPKVSRVLTAYFYDNPECYYVSNEYIISTSDVKLFKHATVELKYLVNSEDEFNEKNAQLKAAVEAILKDNIKEEMTDFEKELALHDALVEHVDYYEYEDINKIPPIKHTAYAALVEKEAVCDGYSKAFKILLEQAGIENIIVNGTADNVPHAWNMVSLDDKYYHVDVTSDKIIENYNKYVIHTYFNLTDNDIFKTHNINMEFNSPKSNSNKYDYYEQKGYYIDYNDRLELKLREIISKQKPYEILEIKSNDKHSARSIIDMLYELNFNNWRASGKTSVTYSKIENIYVFIK